MTNNNVSNYKINRYISLGDIISAKCYIILINEQKLELKILEMKYDYYYIDSPGLIYISLHSKSEKCAFIDYIIDENFTNNKWKYGIYPNYTKIEKIRAIFQYIFERFPDVKYLLLEDHYFQEKPHKNEYIPSFYFDIFYLGETWYSNHLNAEILDKNIRDIIKNNQYSESYKKRFDTYLRNFIDEHSNQIDILNEYHKKYFHKSNTFREFFNQIINDNPNIDELYEKVKPWLRYYMDTMLFDLGTLGSYLSPLYYISRDNYNNKILDNIIEVTHYDNNQIFTDSILIKYR